MDRNKPVNFAVCISQFAAEMEMNSLRKRHLKIHMKTDDEVQIKIKTSERYMNKPLNKMFRIQKGIKLCILVCVNFAEMKNTHFEKTV